MEEICHVFLGHSPNHLSAGAVARDYQKVDEEDAYATGAAALVPYQVLRQLVLKGKSAAEIAKRFGVSKELVAYRLKVTRLWSMYGSGEKGRKEKII